MSPHYYKNYVVVQLDRSQDKKKRKWRIREIIYNCQQTYLIVSRLNKMKKLENLQTLYYYRYYLPFNRNNKRNLRDQALTILNMIHHGLTPVHGQVSIQIQNLNLNRDQVVKAKIIKRKWISFLLINFQLKTVGNQSITNFQIIKSVKNYQKWNLSLPTRKQMTK